MLLKEIKEWFDIADDDLEAAKYLNTSHKPNGICSLVRALGVSVD